MNSGNLNFLEPSRPLQACNGTALPFFFSRCTFLCIAFIIFIVFKTKWKPYVHRIGKKQMLLLLSKRYLLQTLEIEVLNTRIYCRHAMKQAYQASVSIYMSTLNWVHDLKYSDGLHSHIVTLKPPTSDFQQNLTILLQNVFRGFNFVLTLCAGQSNLSSQGLSFVENVIFNIKIRRSEDRNHFKCWFTLEHDVVQTDK